ncbi:hypothetical protein AAMO2058_000196700 [Amorphochlora amoebiformis]
MMQSYAGVLISTLNRCVKQPQTYMGLLHINQNGTARLDFIQNIDFKFVDILSVRFTKSPEEFVRDLVTFRYRMAKEQVARLKAKLVGMNKMLKLRNPSLLLQVRESHAICFSSPFGCLFQKLSPDGVMKDDLVTDG